MEEEYNEVAERVGVHQAAQQGNLVANQNNQMQQQMEEQEQNLAEAQLDVEATLTKIYHLLKQDILKPNSDGILEWMNIADSKKRVLTEEGVDKIMQIMNGYINKETLLSNFDDKMIARRMLKFCLALNALMFMKYEIYFRTPTLEECQAILQSRINEKIKKIKMNKELMEKEVDINEIKQEVLKKQNHKLNMKLQRLKQNKLN